MYCSPRAGTYCSPKGLEGKPDRTCFGLKHGTCFGPGKVVCVSHHMFYEIFTRLIHRRVDAAGDETGFWILGFSFLYIEILLDRIVGKPVYYIL